MMRKELELKSPEKKERNRNNRRRQSIHYNHDIFI